MSMRYEKIIRKIKFYSSFKKLHSDLSGYDKYQKDYVHLLNLLKS